MIIKNSKKIFLIATLFLFLPSLSILFNKNCNFYSDYLFCYNSPNGTIKIINFVYLALVFLALSLGYFGILKNKARLNSKYLLIILLLFFLTTSFTTTDIFYYKGVAKGEIEKNINPYKGGFEKDISFINVDGEPMDKPVMYPPGFIQINKVIYKASPQNEFLLMYTYKLFATLTFLLTFYLIKKYYSTKIATAFVLNPLFLFEFVANAHLDVYFIFFITVSILLLLKNKTYISIYSLFLASLIKFNAILLVPIYGIYKILKSKKLIQYCTSTGAVLLTILVGISTIVISYRAYWFGKETLLGVSLQADWPYNSLFERIVFTKLNPYLYILDGKYNAQSFRDVWLLLVLLGGAILVINVIKNLEPAKNIKKLVTLNFSISKNSVLFYSGFLMFIFPIFGLRYFLPWYLTWSAIYFMFSKFKNKNRVLFLQTLILAIYYPAIYLLGHFTLGVTNTKIYNITFILETILLVTITYDLVKQKILIYEQQN